MPVTRRTGSIATDHLMHFPGRFAEQLLADQLHKVSLSFLVDDLVVRRGGIAPNIAFGMGQLGLRPVLVGAVGADFDDYRAWLERHGVDCDSVHVSEIAHTARFVCTTDEDMCQIASFYAGAMSEARNIELAPVADRTGGVDLVIISPNDPDAMVRHTQECRDRGYRFVADPSQQLARMSGEELRAAHRRRRVPVHQRVREEPARVEDRPVSDAEILHAGRRPGDHARQATASRSPAAASTTVHVPVAKEHAKLDPTGVGDGVPRRLLRRRALGPVVGARRPGRRLLATLVLETVGTQEYLVKRAGVRQSGSPSPTATTLGGRRSQPAPHDA